MQEEPGPSKKRLRKLQRNIERQERHERLDACVTEVDLDADDF
jgi:hypothetical protein